MTSYEPPVGRERVGEAPLRVERERASRGLLIAGYVFALLLPIVGFVLGVVVIVKNRTAHGVAIMLLSLFSWAIAAMLFFAMPASADLPPRKAAASDARYAAESQARQDFGVVLRGRQPVLRNRRSTRHSRRVDVVIPIAGIGRRGGRAEYAVWITHTQRVRRVKLLGAAL